MQIKASYARFVTFPSLTMAALKPANLSTQEDITIMWTSLAKVKARMVEEKKQMDREMWACEAESMERNGADKYEPSLVEEACKSAAP